MGATWAATEERCCSHCLRWMPVTSIKPGHSMCWECDYATAKRRRAARGDERHLPPTARQVAVIQAIARHGSQKDAAAALGLRVQTVKNALGPAYRRLGVESMTEALYTLWLRDLWGET